MYLFLDTKSQVNNYQKPVEVRYDVYIFPSNSKFDASNKRLSTEKSPTRNVQQ